jgi:hypothetical protein
LRAGWWSKDEEALLAEESGDGTPLIQAARGGSRFLITAQVSCRGVPVMARSADRVGVAAMDRAPVLEGNPLIQAASSAAGP